MKKIRSLNKNKVTIFNVMQMDDPLRMVSELTQTDYGSTGLKFPYIAHHGEQFYIMSRNFPYRFCDIRKKFCEIRKLMFTKKS